jgi:hypothetical protein
MRNSAGRGPPKSRLDRPACGTNRAGERQARGTGLGPGIVMKWSGQVCSQAQPSPSRHHWQCLVRVREALEEKSLLDVSGSRIRLAYGRSSSAAVMDIPVLVSRQCSSFGLVSSRSRTLCSDVWGRTSVALTREVDSWGFERAACCGL